MNFIPHSPYSAYLAKLFRVYSLALNKCVPDSPDYNKLYKYWLNVRKRLLKAMYNYQ